MSYCNVADRTRSSGFALRLGALALAGALTGIAQTHTLATVAIPGLTESSGIVASRRYPDVYWTHNDSGGGPLLFAIRRDGSSAGTWRVPGASAYDWEDIAAAPGSGGRTYLYIGDIGDNQRKRSSVVVYRIPEPELLKSGTQKGVTRPAEVIRLRYPDGPHDAECLLVHPRTGGLYIVTKAKLGDQETGVYVAHPPFNFAAVQTLDHVASLRLPDESPVTLIFGRVTGGDFSPDGSRVVLCDYLAAWEADVPAVVDKVWTGEWRKLDIGARPQGEGICYRRDGKAVLTTSEGARFELTETELPGRVRGPGKAGQRTASP